ncbi:MAG: outer membrane beta-barrel protein [Bacteroidaceae bacterium]|nr:outer membrane beta-barrel protein [Bacteroidaceae bacterium]
MKKITKILATGLLMLCLSATMTSHAQILKGGYFTVDWQFNAPVSNDYANVASGWGMAFEGGYYVIPNMSLGLYISYHTNNKYIGEQVLHLSSTESLYTDQQHSIYQVPFGIASRWRFIKDEMFEPYIGVKLGAMYTRMESNTQVYTYYHDRWGFNVQPEIGMSLYPMPFNRTGIHLALYYSYSTNKSHVLTYNIDGYNNIGFRLGISF